MIDPLYTFHTIAQAADGRKALLSTGVTSYRGKNKIVYRVGRLQLGKVWSAREHRPYTHFAVGDILELADRRYAVSFNFLRLPRELPVSKKWDVIRIVEAYA